MARTKIRRHTQQNHDNGAGICAARGPSQRNDQRQHDDAHHIVDDRGTENGRTFDLPDAPHLGEIGLQPRHEHERDATDVGEIANDCGEVGCRMALARLGGGKERPPEHVQHRRAEDQAGENLTEDRGLPDSVRQRAGELGHGDDERQNQQQVQRMGQVYASRSPVRIR